jgi:hypothetical protein
MIGLSPDITAVSVVRHGVLRLTFADGLTGEVEVLDRMRGPAFEQARTPEGFAAVEVDAETARSSGRAAPTSRPTPCTSASAPACGQDGARPHEPAWNGDRRPYPECNAQLLAGEQAVFHHLPGARR